MYRHILFLIIDNSMTLSTQQQFIYRFFPFFFLFLKVICSLSVLPLSCFITEFGFLSLSHTRFLSCARSKSLSNCSALCSARPSAQRTWKYAGVRSIVREWVQIISTSVYGRYEHFSFGSRIGKCGESSCRYDRRNFLAARMLCSSIHTWVHRLRHSGTVNGTAYTVYR